MLVCEISPDIVGSDVIEAGDSGLPVNEAMLEGLTLDCAVSCA